MNMNLESSLSRLENVKKWVLAHIGLKSGSHESLGPSWSENFWFSSQERPVPVRGFLLFTIQKKTDKIIWARLTF